MQTMLAKLRELLYPAGEAPFRRSRAGWILVGANLIMTALSMNFFLGMMKFGIGDWLMLNTCSPSIFLFVFGFLLGSPTILLAGTVMMSYYGTTGLFVFGWKGTDLIAQTGHILMTALVIYAVIEAVRNRRWKSWAIGMTLGILCWIPFNVSQTFYMLSAPDTMKKLFSGELIPPGYTSP